MIENILTHIGFFACIISIVLFIVGLCTKSKNHILLFTPCVLTTFTGICIFTQGIINQINGVDGICFMLVGTFATVLAIRMISYIVRNRYSN